MKMYLKRRTDTGSVWREMHQTRKTGLRTDFHLDGTCSFHVCRTTISNGFPEAGGGGVSAEVSCTEATGTDATPEAASDDDDDGGDGDSDPDGRQPRYPSLPLRATLCNAANLTGALLPKNPDSELWRLPAVLQRYPVSRGTWLAGVRAGIYPKPVKIGIRAVAWKASDIRALVASL